MEPMTTKRSRAAAAPAPVRRVPRRTGRDTGEESAVAESFYRDLVWNLRNGVLAVFSDGRIAVMNDVAYRIFGIEPKPSDIGRPYTDVLKDVPDICRIIESAFELSHLPNRAEHRLKRTNKVIGYTLSQVRDPRGVVTGATLFFKDLTRVEQLEERERLRDRLAALGEMAAAIAHEVKNPLAGIEVMAGLLKRQLAGNEDALSILNDIIKEAKMANAIVIEVLDFVRPIRLQVEKVGLASVVRDAISMAESHVPRGAIEVSVSIPDDLPDIQGDPHQIRQVFTNLLTNAFEAMEGRGEVTITASLVAAEEEVAVGSGVKAAPALLVEVSDNGPGVTPEVMEKMFSPFFTTKARGSGLGLSIVRKIVDAHDGRIDVSARPGGGVRFQVTLPVTGNHELFKSN
jgi:signal transduction histidine kinase